MNCPVCPRQDLEEEALECPNCGADLTPLRRVAGLARREYNSALECARQGGGESAMRHASAAAALDPGWSRPKVLLGKLLWIAGRKREAAVVLAEAAALSPGDGLLPQMARSAARGAALRRLANWGAGAAGVILLLTLPYVVYRSRLADTVRHWSGEVAVARSATEEARRDSSAYRAVHLKSNAEYADLASREAQWRERAAVLRAQVAAGRKAAVEERARTCTLLAGLLAPGAESPPGAAAKAPGSLAAEYHRLCRE
ncbi:MAG: hypothetical protein HZB13_10505 [Acidobacteria bacterium]|nr:hypothetical protein [Acidobacteriota bacterium]